jgi:hypothetical protein
LDNGVGRQSAALDGDELRLAAKPTPSSNRLGASHLV